MENPQGGCRLYVLVATKAPIALVVRRGPSDWFHLLEWDLAKLSLAPGAWFHGTIYPRRSDISPDGRLFGYFALKGGAPGEWNTYFAVSKVPWLQALAAWETLGTWTWGCQFTGSADLNVHACLSEKPFHGNYPGRVTIEPMSNDWPARDVWNEAKRGWQPVPESDPIELPLAARPVAIMRREQPGKGAGVAIRLAHMGVDFRQRGIEGVQMEYFLEGKSADPSPLDDAAWADWDHDGRLLVATKAGALEVFECDAAGLRRIWSEDLTERTPQPEAAPGWASSW